MEKREFQYKEELKNYAEYIENMEGEAPELAPYELIKKDKRYKVFAETEKYLKYIFHHEDYFRRFTIVTIIYLETRGIEATRTEIHRDEFEHMAEAVGLL